MKQNEIAIIGAGLGGLVLASVLHKHGFVAIVYEADPSPTSRKQGGQLDIHVNDGQAALKAAGLYEKFLGLVHVGGSASRILGTKGEILFDDQGTDDGSRPEVQRGDLRRLLLDSIPADQIRWGHKVAGIQPLADGRHTISFTNESEVTCGLLVGAGGAWSKVRNLLSDERPKYTGVSFIETYLFDCDRCHPSTSKAVGKGAMYSLKAGRGIQAHREANNILHAYIALEKSVDWFSAIDLSDTDKAKAILANEFKEWAPELMALITDTDTKPVIRPIFSLSKDHQWKRKAGVTLLGDAAHLMPPSGDGANLAMFDGAELARFLILHNGDIEAALTDYERELFPRSHAFADDAIEIFDICFGPESPQSLLKFFTALK